MEVKKENILFAFGAGLIIALIVFKDEKKTNAQHLETLSPKVKDRFKKFIAELTAKGYAPIITSSKRGYFKQARLYSKDKRNAPPGTSEHEHRNALDLVIKYKGAYLGKNTPVNVWLASGVPQIAGKHGLKWGGNFKGYFDAVHFQGA